MKYYLGVDNGGTVTKAALFDESGLQLCSASVETKAAHPKPGFSERDMEEMWGANCAVIQKTLSASGINPADVRAIAVCGHGKGLYLWGRNDKAARPGIISTDSRAASYAEHWREAGKEKAAFEFSCQHILPCQPLPLIAWLRDNEPECLENTRYVFSCKDYVRFRLTGEAYSELTDASGNGFLNLHTGELDKRILEILGLDEFFDLIPPVKASTDICGRVTKEAARLTGLAEGTPVAGGMFDIDACALSASLTDTQHVCMVAGTWSINEFILPYPIVDGRALMNSLFCMPGYYLIEESSATSAGNLAWYVKNFEKNRSNVYDELNALVSSLGAGEKCPIFLPFIVSGNDNPLAQGSFVGINFFQTKAHFVRSIYEGIAFGHRRHYEKLKRCMTKEPVGIRLVGGASHSKVWAQMFSDVMRLPVETSSADETGAHGCAIAAAVAVGDQPSIEAAARRMTSLSEPIRPIAGNCDAYDIKYERFKRVIQSLDPIWKML